jgi:hypothetical protein
MPNLYDSLHVNPWNKTTVYEFIYVRMYAWMCAYVSTYVYMNVCMCADLRDLSKKKPNFLKNIYW